MRPGGRRNRMSHIGEKGDESEPGVGFSAGRVPSATQAAPLLAVVVLSYSPSSAAR